MKQSDLLMLIGSCLYGRDAPWGQRMATDLNVNRRTIMRWMNGTEETPDGVWLELRDALERRATAVEQARREIERFRAPLLPEATDG